MRETALDTITLELVAEEEIEVEERVTVVKVADVDVVAARLVLEEAELEPQPNCTWPSSYVAVVLEKLPHAMVVIAFKFAPENEEKGTVIVWVAPVSPLTVKYLDVNLHWNQHLIPLSLLDSVKRTATHVVAEHEV